MLNKPFLQKVRLRSRHRSVQAVDYSCWRQDENEKDIFDAGDASDVFNNYV